MLLDFTKMNGAGNDFILIDNRDQSVELNREQITRLCDRHRGVGADGLFLLGPSASDRADWSWAFYNSDGSVAEMCGNGARCFARFAQRLSGKGPRLTVDTEAGLIHATIQGDLVTVNLTPPVDLVLNERLELDSGSLIVHSVNTGVPHTVVMVPDVGAAKVRELGAQIRYHQRFAPKGTNVNFIQVLGPGRIRVRTYERGVEGETLACGTGVAASALVAAKLENFPSPIHVRVEGGENLVVGFQASGEGFSEVQLTGPATFVFEGKIEV